MTGATTFSPQFLADLEAIFLQINGPPPVPSVDLDWLATHFDTWRSRDQERLRQQLNLLPSDDPLKCPVSLFGTMDYGRLETAHTRTLAWLLDPGREHGFGDHLLRAVLTAVGGPSTPCPDAKTASEHAVSRNEAAGRLDVVVWGQSVNAAGTLVPWLLVIEGKVDALEGDEQLARYDAWIEHTAGGRAVYRVFLTAKGYEAETGTEDWRPMSFLQLVCVLRGTMWQVHDAAGYHFLRYYLAGVLMDVCRWVLPLQPNTPDPHGAVEYLRSLDSPAVYLG